jgi:BirA family transcriptional regulator, biotin operon repressor / biotin---[acetyl-CoA-carboxylase] ligase
VTEGSPAPWRLKIYEALPSTSDFCRNLAGLGEPDGLAVMARRQTAGRGSRGRGWRSLPGNLALSALLRPRESAREAAQWSLLAGVALAEALAPFLPTGPVPVLKWPNDVLLGGGKLAGILIDAETDAHGRLEWVVVGIGVNLLHAPEVEGRAVAAVAEHAAAPAPEDVAQSVLTRLAHWRRVREADGFAPIRAAFLAHAQAPGTPITLRLGDTVREGAFAGLDEDGSLLVRSGGQMEAFAAGEILLPRGA